MRLHFPNKKKWGFIFSLGKVTKGRFLRFHVFPQYIGLYTNKDGKRGWWFPY